MKTGKTAISRTLNAMKKDKSQAVKDYMKAYDEASNLSDAASKAWADTKKKRLETGKTAITRVFNNIKYDSGVEKHRAKKQEYKNAKQKAKQEWSEAAKKYADSTDGSYDRAADKYLDDIKKAKAKYKSR